MSEKMSLETFPGFTVDVYSLPKPGKGHDAWFSSSLGAAVVDGATPLGPDYPDDLPGFASKTAATLGSAPFEGIEKLHTGAISIVSAEYKPAGYKRTAATSVVRLDGDYLHCAVLGDCRILIGTSKGVVDVFDSTLTKLEQVDALTGVPSRQASIRRRTKVFEQQLYRIFGDRIEAAIPKVGATLALGDAQTIILMSDGAWNVLPQEPEKMLDALTGGPLDVVFEANKQREPSDDTTILRLERTVDRQV